MERLFNFIYTYRAFFTFFLLEFSCVWLIIENNQYQSTKYFNTSNRFVANINSVAQSMREYISLRDINSSIAEENASLHNQLEGMNRLIATNKLNLRDTSRSKRYDYISAKVVNNSTRLYKNFITIDRGSTSGLEPGMGVISGEHAVGKVKTVS
ncbi:MAG TPA: rod shape-determining protein MreC, partial [Cytophagales bacterium]|nr:rod shape-determining protein MreC [Cytophagales bacterium]